MLPLCVVLKKKKKKRGGCRSGGGRGGVGVGWLGSDGGRCFVIETSAIPACGLLPSFLI